MYSGYISVDFPALEAQINRLNEYACFIESIYDRVRVTYNALSDMSLGDAEDELLYNIHALEKIMVDIRSKAAKLKKIAELYAECENSITKAVYDLSYNMPQIRLVGSEKLLPISKYELYISDVKPGSFMGHTIINDDWLDDLINKTEVSE